MFGKLMGAASVGSSLAGLGLFNRFLSDMAMVVMLAIVGAFMTCVLFLSLLILVYIGLVHYGLDPTVAIVILGVIACLLSSGLIALAVIQIRQLRLIHFSGFQRHRTVLPIIGNVVEAFFDGLLHPERSTKNS